MSQTRQSITAADLSLVFFFFFFPELTKELLAALGNRSLLRFLGITDACWVTSSAGSVSFHCHSGSVRTFVRILRRAT